MDGSDALVNTNYENYCLARADGLTQRQAMLKAYPKRAKWKSSAIDSAAARLEADRRIKARIIYLKSAIAKLAILSRAEVLAGMSEAFSESLKTMKQDGIGPDSLAGVARIGKTLIDAIPDDVPTAAVQFVADFGLLIAEPFLSMHRRVAQDKGGNFWLYGGRASTKSSSISLEIVDGLMRHRERSAFAMVKRKTDIRDGVYEQFQWALAKLGVSEQWTCTVSPLRMIRKETGQVIAFRGGDNAEKTKSIKAPAGTYFAYTWIEEADQFSGMSELRTIYQSVTRDAGGDAVYFRFHSFNPPRSKKSWANKQIADLIAAGETVYKANYCDVPREWLPAQVYEDAERLKQVDHEAYLHEYMGEPVGFSGEVFGRVEVRTITDAERKSLDYHYYGVDWGFSQDPFAWVKIAYNAKTRELFILDEIVGTGFSNQESASRVAVKLKTERKSGNEVIEDAEPYAVVWCDSAEPKSINDFRELGINAKAADKQGIHNVRNSIKWLQWRSKIIIDPTCKTAAAEFSSYTYEVTKSGEVTGLLPDADNHTIDAVRYACMTLITDRRLT